MRQLFFLLHDLGKLLLWAGISIFALWAAGALYFDFPVAKPWVSLAFIGGLLLLGVWIRNSFKRAAALILASLTVLTWWLGQKPSNTREWQPEVAQTGWAEIRDDVVTLHNVRNFDYRTTTDSDPRWETRTVLLSQLTGVEMAICYWGSPYMAHPIVSFQFADSPPVCFSIETRKEVGEKYSAIGGLYRQYELIYIVADERDVIRVRSNFRKNEDVYLYSLTLPPEKARERFMEYITTLNELHQEPRWYNAITTNCTTGIRSQHPAAKRARWDYRILVNGKGDEMLYERGALQSWGLPFAELKAKSHINETAKQSGSDLDFSKRIRENRAGF